PATFDLSIVIGLAGTGIAWYFVMSRHLVKSRLAAWVGGFVGGVAPGVTSPAELHPHLVAQVLMPPIAPPGARFRRPRPPARPRGAAVARARSADPPRPHPCRAGGLPGVSERGAAVHHRSRGGRFHHRVLPEPSPNHPSDGATVRAGRRGGRGRGRGAARVSA